MAKPGIGIQLHTVRDALKEDFRGTIDRLCELGFQGVELAFFYGGLSPDELAKFLRERNLPVIGIYEKADKICDPNAEVYQYAEAVGCKYITFGVGRKALEQDFDGAYDVCCRALETATSKDKILCYHAHAHEFDVYTDNRSYLDEILNAAGTKELAFAADTGWIHQGGETVITYMERYCDRIPFFHLKDMTADGEVTELGNGVIDLPTALRFAADRDIPWVSYEQEQSRIDPLTSTRISAEYLQLV